MCIRDSGSRGPLDQPLPTVSRPFAKFFKGRMGRGPKKDLGAGNEGAAMPLANIRSSPRTNTARANRTNVNKDRESKSNQCEDDFMKNCHDDSAYGGKAVDAPINSLNVPTLPPSVHSNNHDYFVRTNGCSFLPF